MDFVSFFFGALFLVVLLVVAYAASEWVIRSIVERVLPVRKMGEGNKYEITILRDKSEMRLATIQAIQSSIGDFKKTLGHLRMDLGEVEETLLENDGQLDTLIGRMNSLGERQDELSKAWVELEEKLKGDTGLPLYYGVILENGAAVHETTEKGSKILHVLNKHTRVMIYEIQEKNGVNWARIEESGWIHGGWEYRHPPRIQGAA